MRKYKKYKLIKNWHYTHYNGRQCFAADSMIGGIMCKEGLYMEHFYGTGQGEIIPARYFIAIHTKRDSKGVTGAQ